MKRVLFILAALLLVVPAVQAANETVVTGWSPTAWASQLSPELAAQAEVAYLFNEASGSVAYDASDNVNNATVLGTAAFSSAGKFGNAMYFDGVASSYLTAANMLPLWTTELTMMAWVKHDPLSGRHHVFVNSPGYFTFERLWSGVPYGFVQTDSPTWSSGNTAYPRDEWVHVAMVFQGNRGDGQAEVRYYVNGAYDGGLVWTPGYSNIAHSGAGGYAIEIGAATNLSGRQMMGYMDDVAIFYDALDFAPIPEPGTIALAGMLLLGLVRRKM